MKRIIRSRKQLVTGLALVCLALIAVCIFPALLALLVSAPKMATGLSLAIGPFALLKCEDMDGGGGGGLMHKVGKALEALDSKTKTLEIELENLKGGNSDIAKLKATANDHQTKIANLHRSIKSGGQSKPGEVSEGLARACLGAAYLVGLRQGRFSGRAADFAEGLVRDGLGIEAKSALTDSDIPLPTTYGSEVSELVSQFGQARLYGTVYPLGSGLVKLPKLKTDTAFGLLAQSAVITEVSPQTELVTFTPEKFGGLVRLPSEIDEDSSFEMGSFLARYAARRIAAAEDHQFFVSTGAGSGVNGTAKGLTALVSDNSKTTGMAASAGKTAYSDTTLAVWRQLRTVVDEAANRRGAYYVNRSFEGHFSSLNTGGDKPYQANAGENATLDGFPIRWVPTLPAYSTSANAGKVYALFGDASFMYLGIRRGMEFATSREAAFGTDEILVRALERMTVGLMADGAMAGLKTPAN